MLLILNIFVQINAQLGSRINCINEFTESV